jgi:hypothetical protein
MIPEAHASHRMPCRLRVKIPSKKGDVSYFSALAERLSECPAVQEIRVNPRIGSALILHKGDAKTVSEFAKEHDVFHLKRAKRAQKTLFAEVAHTFGGYNRNLRKWTDGELDIQSLVFLSLVVSGIWEIARGNLTMPAWYTAFYYALGVFTRSQVDEWEEGGDLIPELDDLEGD